ncbi:hypothetical protein [Aquisalimonas asiatica]|uniref:Uncharacterized protein n=1 Tax=Aquisalimonas asiatica TaxID=406100 RepID=A0A1H8RW58_9GAMM|nr:hypothetical protein [Aquisalimonas asiatica]SEO70592.1 hypothetical protein SAMN04488052_102297 [Aquisalimonas asiatica]
MGTRAGKSGIGNTTRRNERLVALFVLAVLLFNYPILSLFAGDRLVFGLPLLYVYLFVAWGVVIGLTGWILRRRH